MTKWACVCVCVHEQTTSGQLTVLHHTNHLQWHRGIRPLLRQEAMTLKRKWVTNNNWRKSPDESFIKSWWTLNQRLGCCSCYWRVGICSVVDIISLTVAEEDKNTFACHVSTTMFVYAQTDANPPWVTQTEARTTHSECSNCRDLFKRVGLHIRNADKLPEQKPHCDVTITPSQTDHLV